MSNFDESGYLSPAVLKPLAIVDFRCQEGVLQAAIIFGDNY